MLYATENSRFFSFQLLSLHQLVSSNGQIGAFAQDLSVETVMPRLFNVTEVAILVNRLFTSRNRRYRPNMYANQRTGFLS